MNYSVLTGKQLKQGVDTPMWDLLFRTFVIPADFKFKLIEVTATYIARPDLVSLDVFNTPDYADLICKINGISNPCELNEGMKLVIPDVSDLYKFNVSDTKANNETTSTSSQDSNVSYKQKLKNEPRKANEQIVGDKNFRIDKQNKIVIY